MKDTRPFVLRSKQGRFTYLWMKADGLWSREERDAVQFKMRRDAYAYARSKGYGDFELQAINAVRLAYWLGRGVTTPITV